MQGPQPTSPFDLAAILTGIMQRLDRLDERTRDLATRVDLETMKRELVAKDYLEPRLTALQQQIAHLETELQQDHSEFQKKIDEIEQDRIATAERFWIKLAPIGAVGALIISILEFFFSHFHFTP